MSQHHSDLLGQKREYKNYMHNVVMLCFLKCEKAIMLLWLLKKGSLFFEAAVVIKQIPSMNPKTAVWLAYVRLDKLTSSHHTFKLHITILQG